MPLTVRIFTRIQNHFHQGAFDMNEAASGRINKVGRAARRSLAVSMVMMLGTALAQAQVTAPQPVKDHGRIVFCSDISFPPFEYYDAQTNEPAGFDVEFGQLLASTLGVKAEFKNIGFDALIPSLQAGQCDAILSGLFDKPERRKVIDLVDYASVGNSLIVKSNNAVKFNALTDLSGRSVAVEAGSTLEHELDAASDQLKQSGKPAIKIAALPKASDAFQQLSTGLVEAYYGTTAQASYFNKQNPGSVKLASPQTSSFFIGVGTPKSDAALHDAVTAALKTVVSNGKYDALLKKWSFESAPMKP
jgi:polar amino acid transport system substrate-binding protein